MTITLNWIFVPTSVICLGIGVAWNTQQYPDADELFGPDRNVRSASGTAATFVPPRGIPSIHVITSEGKLIRFDCIAVPELCPDQALERKRVTIEADAVRVKDQLYWPIWIRSNGKLILPKDLSRARYPIFIEKQYDLRNFWFAMSAAAIALAALFGRRPLSYSGDARFHKKRART